MKFLTLSNGSKSNGSKIAYHKTEGPKKGLGLIFLGGFMSDMNGTKATFFEAVAQKLGYTFVRFDYLGHGSSSGKFEEGTIGQWKKNALTVIDQLTEGPQVLIGSSMGGWIMVLAALERKARIQGLLGIASAPDFVEDLLKLRPEDQALIESKGVCYVKAEYEERPFPITRTLIEEGRTHKVLQKKISLDCPVHLVHGLKDTDVPWQLSLKLAEAFESSQVQITLVKEGGHRLSTDRELKILEKSLINLIEETQIKQ